jgi:hypothetical protein
MQLEIGIYNLSAMFFKEKQKDIFVSFSFTSTFFGFFPIVFNFYRRNLLFYFHF